MKVGDARMTALLAMVLALAGASGCQHESNQAPETRAASPTPDGAAPQRKPVVKVLGLHPVPGYKGAYMLELTIDAPPGSVDAAEFRQEDPDLPRYDWPAAYDPQILSPDGTLVVLDPAVEAKHAARTRMVFFLNDASPDRPLLTPAGPVPLPKPTPIPERLKQIRYDAPI